MSDQPPQNLAKASSRTVRTNHPEARASSRLLLAMDNNLAAGSNSRVTDSSPLPVTASSLVMASSRR